MNFYMTPALAATIMAGVAQAEVRMPLIFGDHMVLQQDATLPIWGWANPGEKVTVTFANQQVATVGGADGKWRVELAPVATDGKGLVLKNVDPEHNPYKGIVNFGERR